jgi:hypothetical protein
MCYLSSSFGLHLYVEVGGLRRYYMSYSSEPHLLTKVSSDAVTCFLVLGSVFLRVEFQCCHMSHGSALYLPERGGSVLSCVPRLRALPF